jgi:CHAD domain-containing protein
MAFRFKLSEPFEEGCKRIAREQIERAQCQLKAPSDPVLAVHETRKALKRLRALLRLIRPALGDAAFHEENSQLRDIAGSLSSARDRHVLLETVTKLEAASSVAREGLGQVLREVLTATNGEQSPTVEVTAMKKAQGRLAEAKKRLGKLQLAGKGFDIVGPGLEASYRKTRRALHAAYVECSDESFHEWRKGTQQHWRHMMLLSRAWPEDLAARVSEARRLSQLLGDDHDLVLLVAFVQSDAGARIGPARAVTLEKLVRQRQTELRTLAHPAGLRLFAEGARALQRRMAAYWDAAVALKEHEPDADKPAAPASASRQPGRRRRPPAAARA